MADHRSNVPTPTLPVGLPDDWVFDRDLECPQCRYNLRMLHNPRCPECGTVFRWQALLHVGCPRCGESLRQFDGSVCLRCGLALNWERLLGDVDPRRFKQFEYTHGPWRAAFGTWLSALRPRRFWAGVHLEAPPVVRRLRWFRRIGFVMTVVGISVAFVPVWGRYGLYDPEWLTVLALALILPLVTTLALPRFTPTLARFRIRRDQLLRVTAYASTGALWVGLAYLLAGLLVIVWDLTMVGPGRQGVYIDLENFFSVVFDGRRWSTGASAATEALSTLLGTILFVLSFAWWWRFLYVALRYYLRLDARNAVALFLSTQVIGFLILSWLFLNVTFPNSWALIDALGRLIERIS